MMRLDPPDTYWKKDAILFFSRRFALLIKILYPVALIVPVAASDIPAQYAAAVVGIVAVMAGTFGAGESLTADLNDGILLRFALTPLSPRRVVFEILVVNAVLDFIQLLPALLLVYVLHPAPLVWDLGYLTRLRPLRPHERRPQGSLRSLDRCRTSGGVRLPQPRRRRSRLRRLPDGAAAPLAPVVAGEPPGADRSTAFAAMLIWAQPYWSLWEEVGGEDGEPFGAVRYLDRGSARRGAMLGSFGPGQGRERKRGVAALRGDRLLRHRIQVLREVHPAQGPRDRRQPGDPGRAP